MMARQDIVEGLVIRAMADDYEDFEMIMHETVTWATQRGLDVSREEVVEALEQLIGGGYVQAWLLSPTSPAKAVSYSREEIDNLYFYVTPKGQEFLRHFE